MSIDLGTMYRATLLDVRDASGNPVVPSTLTFTVTLPDQTTANVTAVQDPDGPQGQKNFHADYLSTQEGLHRAAWLGTVPNIAKTDYFNVISYRALVSLDEVKDRMGILDTRFDDKLRSVIAGVTQVVEEKCGTCIIRTYTNDWITPGDRFSLRLPHGPLPDSQSVTSIVSVYPGGPQWLAANLIVNPDAGTVWTLNQMGFYYGPWLATYKAGRKVIPAGILSGAQEIIWDLWATVRGVTGDQEEPTIEEVTAMEQALATPLNYRIPIRALAYLDPHTMPGFA